MAGIHGVKSYLTLAAETTWGTAPATPVYYHLPVESYGVVMKRDRRNASVFTGQQQRKHGKSFRGMPAGTIVAPLYGWKPNSNSLSLMQYLLDWALSEPETVDKISRLADWAEGPDVANIRHLGLRVNGWTIEGSADSGTVKVTLDVMGKTEAALVTAQTLPNDREGCVEMEFTDCSYTHNSVLQDCASWTWKGQNNLAATYLGGTSPSYLSAGELVETFGFSLIKTADTFPAYNRAFAEVETTGTLVLKGLHNGTGGGGTFTQCSIAFGRLAFIEPQDARARNVLIKEDLMFDVLKPDTSTAAKVLTYSEV